MMDKEICIKCAMGASGGVDCTAKFYFSLKIFLCLCISPPMCVLEREKARQKERERERERRFKIFKDLLLIHSSLIYYIPSAVSPSFTPACHSLQPLLFPISTPTCVPPDKKQLSLSYQPNMA